MTRYRDKLAIERACNAEVRESVSLKDHTSFRIGGPAAMFVNVADAERLAATLEAARAHGIATLILGGGTNLLVGDTGFDGLAIRIRFEDLEIDTEGGVVRAGAGVASARLVEATIAAGLKGLEFAAGLPGTVGGAVVGNAGCFGSTFGDRLVRAQVVHPRGGVEAIEDRSWFGFGYRRSCVPETGAALTEVGFALEPGDPSELGELAAGYLEQRATRHPPAGTCTAGSYFKNLPPDEPGGRRRAAGELLDRVGAKQLRVGDAAVFERHANIVVNVGAATARDVLELTGIMAERVQQRFGVALEPEVRFVGEL